MIATLVNLYMRAKRSLSRCAAKRAVKAELPEFKTPQEIARFIEASVTYTRDEALADLYTHPGAIMHWVQWNLVKRNYGAMRLWPLHIDCDDVSAFAWAAAQKLPDLESAHMLVFRYPTIGAMFKDLWRNIRDRRDYLLYFHEGCLVIEKTGNRYLIDANGIYPVSGPTGAAELISSIMDVELVPQETSYPFEV